jgi:hypothetical protein
MKYYVFWDMNEPHEVITGMEEFTDASQVTEFINKNPTWAYTIIRGFKMDINPVQKVTVLELVG